MLRVGIIGVGNIGYTHARSVYDGHIENMCLVGLCDISREIRTMAAQEFPNVAFFEGYEDLLSQDLDAVIVSVPHPLHAQVATAAFRAGKHVLVEKPMEITLSRAKALAFEAKKSGKVFGIMFNQRTGSLFQKARDIVRGGLLGQLKRTSWVITNWYRSQHYYDSGSWRATWSGEGGGVLMNQAPHQLDLWQWICGMPESVTAFCDVAKYHHIQVEDSATIHVRFPGGADGTFITSTGEYPGTNRLEIVGTKGKLVLEDGKLKWWQLEEDERDVCRSAAVSFPKIPCSYREIPQDDTGSSHRKILQNFANAIEKGEPLLAPGCDGICEVTLQNAAYLSAWTGRTVTLPLDEALYDQLLARLQTDSPRQVSTVAERHPDYSTRWQINW
ncbi:MAG: Gfo/Idh/MocA family oxidoreductase [Ruminococcaceae bacterium]|nr:Gfo/Idh/MocA family oxidoreductase [Oscillospiraceae bacterium]